MNFKNELLLTDDDFLISKTDLKGIIVFANDDFVRVSGYSEKELIGTPHNVIRNPLMPQEAFRELWKTIQSGGIWKGPVLNLNKHGHPYWTQAMVKQCILDNGSKGYVSHRIRLFETDVQKALKSYNIQKNWD